MVRLGRLLRVWLTGLGLFFVSIGSAADEPVFDDAALEFFEKEVRPILITRCYECHSSDKSKSKGGLRLDSRASVLQGGETGSAVSLDQTSTSLLISAINYGDTYQMPPKSKLPASEIAALTKWVELKLPWPQEATSTAGEIRPFDLQARTAEHWCWQPIASPAIPDVNHRSWPLTDIDRFILAKLETNGIAPALPAEPRALLRRVYFDLIGLPPSPAEVRTFLQDSSPQALEDVVD